MVERIGDWSRLKSAMAGEVQAQLQYTMDEVDKSYSESRAARQFKESNQKSVGWHGLSIRVRSYSCNANAKLNFL